MALDDTTPSSALRTRTRSPGARPRTSPHWGSHRHDTGAAGESDSDGGGGGGGVECGGSGRAAASSCSSTLSSAASPWALPLPPDAGGSALDVCCCSCAAGGGGGGGDTGDLEEGAIPDRRSDKSFARQAANCCFAPVLSSSGPKSRASSKKSAAAAKPCAVSAVCTPPRSCQGEKETRVESPLWRRRCTWNVPDRVRVYICTHPCVCAVEHGVCQGQDVGTVCFFALQTRLRAVCLQQRHERSQRCFGARQRLSCGAAEAEAFLHGMLT